MADYRPCLHQAINLHAGRLVSSYSSFLDCCSVNEEGNLCGMSVDNFLLKLQVFAIIHSSRSLLTLAADCAVNATLHDTERLCSLLTESKRKLRHRIAELKSADIGSETSDSASGLSGGDTQQQRRDRMRSTEDETEKTIGYGDTDETVSFEEPRAAAACPFFKSGEEPQIFAFDDLLGSFFHQRGQNDSPAKQSLNMTHVGKVAVSEEQRLEVDLK
ncbi:hypothetical protein TGDOM2_206680 [Toxoplasma gondii GAB2-2007-GAL-DOM2]|uniref:Uncharacterized protein n=5 Tax=Toxoplasma gondii TaxID=5811 RepID=V5BD02_TOXGV|nr:hypothetical protein TGVEG_206680 [Toxoplasma gondii VEG]KFG32201.1 hypothetical protein TGDOM2_206680 [Toxoplasma gondii GAB2-2007-GAL-DOM2]KFG33962.1 hypothetical protein TGP89_206680 [Toxoplasma gondii p89]KFH08075.1 hypothetical protein TGMAS_206680 [Toxoplasma gondii MAS]PIM02301.1 hypothetical protein TGCOUG_206680 [Toxoplasma gondii COUG]PUA85717.1 hypothetical protein TGBR9_206680 [Toxoplasma gondii TgCATBr9]